MFVMFLRLIPLFLMPMLSVARAAIEWAAYYIAKPGEFMLGILYDALPDSGGLGMFQSFVKYIDCWVDMALLLSFVSYYFVFWATWTAYRFIKSWIPTVASS